MAMPPPPSGAPPPPPPPGAPQAAPAQDQQAAGPPGPPPRPFPGSYDNLHTEAKQIFVLPGYFHDGCKFQFARIISQNLQVTHQLNLGSQSKPTAYSFGATYLGSKRKSPVEGYPIVMGEIDTEGSLTAQIIHEINSAVKIKFHSQSQAGKFLGGQGELEYTGSDFTSGLKLVNVNPITESGICILNYLQKITPGFAMGGEFQYQYGPMGEGAAIAIGGKYSGDRWSTAASISQMGTLNATYSHAVNEKCNVGTELSIDLARGEAVTTAGYQYSFRQSVFRGQVGSNGQIAATLFKALTPAVTFIMTGLVDHVQHQSRFGIGLVVEA